MRPRTSLHLGVGLTLISMSFTRCEERGTSDWLIVDNRTDSTIVIMQVQPPDGVIQDGGMGPHWSGIGAGAWIVVPLARCRPG